MFVMFVLCSICFTIFDIWESLHPAVTPQNQLVLHFNIQLCHFCCLFMFFSYVVWYFSKPSKNNLFWTLIFSFVILAMFSLYINIYTCMYIYIYIYQQAFIWPLPQTNILFCNLIYRFVMFFVFCIWFYYLFCYICRNPIRSSSNHLRLVCHVLLCRKTTIVTRHAARTTTHHHPRLPLQSRTQGST